MHTGYAARLVCTLLDFSRCQLYPATAPASDDEADLSSGWPASGPRRLTAILRREGRLVNGKRLGAERSEPMFQALAMPALIPPELAGIRPRRRYNGKHSVLSLTLLAFWPLARRGTIAASRFGLELFP